MISTNYWRMCVCTTLLLSSRVASQQPVKIDDAKVYSLANPNGIQFSSEGWSTVNPENVDLRYDSTYTWSQAENSNLVYFFRGTAIAHYADKGINRGPIGVSIDGNPHVNVTGTNVGDVRFQQLIWSTTGLSQGDHQIVISNIGTGDPATSIMGVDYLEATPGADGVIIPASFGPRLERIDQLLWVIVDHIRIYFGGYQHSSTTPGATITFKFTGTAVWYFCDRFDSNTLVNISLDGRPGETVDTASSTGAWLTQVLMWSKINLDDGSHTITITHAGTEGKYINVDFFKYMPSLSAPPVSSAPTSGSGTSPFGTTSLATRPSSTSAPAANSDDSSGSKSAPTGAIVGGVVGGVALIALIVGIVIWRRRRRSSQDALSPQHETYIGEAEYVTKESQAPAGSPYTPSPLRTPTFAPTVNYQSGMYVPTQPQNTGGLVSVAPTNYTGTTYVGHPEL
ncbi:hypothetical protein BDV93DRAFT_506651 [Ceratobasidium sp. AG-I]|nr:hypothetical protein BDV93DRAFT_506651 [Ceratobasidium sp. AG-I]